MKKSVIVSILVALANEVIAGKTFWGLTSGQWGLQTGSASSSSDVYGGDGQLSVWQ
jgi:hypothetical protein